MPNPPPLTAQQMQDYERTAMRIRKLYGLGISEPIDPFKLAAQLNVVIRYNGDFDPKDWSGSGKVMPNGQFFVMLNSRSTLERKHATLLHEIVHWLQRHTPTLIGPTGLNEYDKTQEQEADFVAAAILLPMKIVGVVVYQKKSVAEIAKAYGASTELFEMRIKTLGLWGHYQREEVFA